MWHICDIEELAIPEIQVLNYILQKQMVKTIR